MNSSCLVLTLLGQKGSCVVEGDDGPGRERDNEHYSVTTQAEVPAVIKREKNRIKTTEEEVAEEEEQVNNLLRGKGFY